jgi:hypothetical protein
MRAVVDIALRSPQRFVHRCAPRMCDRWLKVVGEFPAPRLDWLHLQLMALACRCLVSRVNVSLPWSIRLLRV